MGFTRKRSGSVGVTFLELGVILALIGLLSSIGYGMVRGARKNALRVRCRAALAQVHRMEVLHAATYGGFSDRFEELADIGLAQPLDPTYDFALSVSRSRDAFRCVAWANLDGDAKVDSLAVDESGQVMTLAED
jgi:Tfp pilus assembly protein PilE